MESLTNEHAVILNCVCWIVILSILNAGVALFKVRICFPAYPLNLVG